MYFYTHVVSWVRVPPEAVRKSDGLGYAVLLCLVDLACFFLPSFSSLIKTCICIICLPQERVSELCCKLQLYGITETSHERNIRTVNSLLEKLAANFAASDDECVKENGLMRERERGGEGGEGKMAEEQDREWLNISRQVMMDISEFKKGDMDERERGGREGKRKCMYTSDVVISTYILETCIYIVKVSNIVFHSV